MNRKLTTGTPQLNPIPVKSPWYMVGIDFVGPISPVADDGSRYILTITDYFTKWAEAIPTCDKSAATVSAVLFKVYYNIFNIICDSLVHNLIFSCSCVWAFPKSSSPIMARSSTTSSMNHLQHFLV